MSECTRASVYVYACVYICTCVCMCVFVSVHVCACTRTYAWMYICMMCVHQHMCICVCDGTHVEGSSLLLPCGSGESNSGHQGRLKDICSQLSPKPLLGVFTLERWMENTDLCRTNHYALSAPFCAWYFMFPTLRLPLASPWGGGGGGERVSKICIPVV